MASVWIVPIIFIVFNIGYYGISTFMPTYLKTVLEIDPASANIYTSVLTFTMIVGVCAVIIDSAWSMRHSAGDKAAKEEEKECEK